MSRVFSPSVCWISSWIPIVFNGLKSGLKILEQIQNNPQSTMKELAKQTDYSRSWVAETMRRLQEQGIIRRVGSKKGGRWEIIHED